MPFDLNAIVRPNILALQPYRCAHQLARYPHQTALKTRLPAFRGVPSTDFFFVGVGSDESIDLAIRVFCVPGKDRILICPPTYGMYTVCANINDVGVVKVPLDVTNGKFSIVPSEIKKALTADKSIKVVFLCSPGNPTGTLLEEKDIKEILEFEEYAGVVVVDEAYIDFCKEPSSVATWTAKYLNLIVIQTLSKSFGLAGIRVGIAIADPSITQIFNNTKAPYNVSTLASKYAIAALEPAGIAQMEANVAKIASQRDLLILALQKLSKVGAILGANDGNFVMAQVVDGKGVPCNEIAFSVYKRLAEVESIVVRFRGNELGCTGCLRISIGTEEENEVLLQKLNALLQ
ncbi:histidinol-phosphate transaminase [Podochytrium sp. JEL0797]|nr:histidinol-phosphate transaminase [Podochytrium sp. JEL0797]